MPAPKKGVAYSFTRALVDQSQPGKFKVSPTIAAGDFRISKDNGTLANLAVLPAVAPPGSVLVLFQLTAAEMTADRISIVGIDQAGNEWGDYHEQIETTVQTIDDVPTVTAVADTVLTRDWLAVGTPPAAHSIWNALRFLRNAWLLAPGTPATLHVKAEDGATDAWTRTVTTDPSATGVTGLS